MPQPHSSLEAKELPRRAHTRLDPNTGQKTISVSATTQTYYVSPETKAWQKAYWQDPVEFRKKPSKGIKSAPEKIILSPRQQEALQKGKSISPTKEDIRYIYQHSDDPESNLAVIEEINPKILNLQNVIVPDFKDEHGFNHYIVGGREFIIVKGKDKRYRTFEIADGEVKQLKQGGGFSTEERAWAKSLEHLGYKEKGQSSKEFQRQIQIARSYREGDPEAKPIFVQPRKVQARAHKRRLPIWRRDASYRYDKSKEGYILKLGGYPPKDAKADLKSIATPDKEPNTWFIPKKKMTPERRKWLEANFKEKAPIGYLTFEEAQIYHKMKRQRMHFKKKLLKRELRAKQVQRVKQERRIRKTSKYYFKRSPRAQKWTQIYYKRTKAGEPTKDSEILNKWKRTGDTGGKVIAEVTNSTNIKEDREKIRANHPDVKFHR